MLDRGTVYVSCGHHLDVRGRQFLRCVGASDSSPAVAKKLAFLGDYGEGLQFAKDNRTKVKHNIKRLVLSRPATAIDFFCLWRRGQHIALRGGRINMGDPRETLRCSRFPGEAVTQTQAMLQG